MSGDEKTESKATYLARRRRRVRQLHVEEGLAARDIAAKLIADGTIETKSFRSAHRLVRSDVAAIREDLKRHRLADVEGTSETDLDSLERQLARMRADREWYLIVADGEKDKNGNDALVTTRVEMPGLNYDSVKLKWPAGERIKARARAEKLSEKIALLEIQLAERRALVATEEGAETPRLTIVPSDGSLDALIELNLRVN